MSEAEVVPGYVPRPDYHDNDLLETVGYVTALWAEQENDYDQLKFILRVYYRALSVSDEPASVDVGFSIYLDRNTTAAFGMFQLLRDAMASMALKSNWLVKVHFTFQDDGLDSGHVYLVMVIPDPGKVYPVTVQEFYGLGVRGWWTHLE